MSLSFYDQFSSTDWESIALSFGKITVIGSFVTSILSYSFGFNEYISIYTLIMALFIAIWEFPILYSCLPLVDKFKEVLLESFSIQLLGIRGVLYIVLSIICFWKSTICVVAGFLLLLNSTLLFLGTTYKNTEADELFTEDDIDDNNNSITRNKDKFGTF